MPKGVKIPFDFIPFPREIWKENLNLSLGEFRVIGYLLARLYFGKSQRPISDEELLNGELRKDGTRIDKGCGLTSRNGLKIARETLIKRGWVKAVNVSTDPHRTQWEYSIRLFGEDEDSIVTPRQSVSQNDNAVSQNDNQTPVPLSQNDTLNIKEEELSTKNKEQEDKPPSKEGFSLIGEEPIYRRKKLSKKEVQEFALAFNPPERIPKGPWSAWIEMRIEKNNCPTPRAIHMAISEMDRLVAEGSDYAAILNKSTIAGYPGLYAATNGHPKANGNGFHNGQQSRINGPGATGHLLDHLPSPEQLAERRKQDDRRLQERRERMDQ